MIISIALSAENLLLPYQAPHTVPRCCSDSTALSAENLLLPYQTPYIIPRQCNDYVSTVPYNLHSSVPMNLNNLHLCQLSDTSSISGSSQRTSFSDAASISSFEVHPVSISHSTSLDSFKDNCQTKQQTSLLRKIVSLNDINSTEADEDYVLPSILPLIDVLCNKNEYLTILPNKVNHYEKITDLDCQYESLHFEQQYSSLVDSVSISHSTSLDSFKDNCQTKQQTSLLRKIVSLNDINSTEADEDYVLPSILPLIDILCNKNEYLTTLPNKVNHYEKITDLDRQYESLHFEQQYSSLVDSVSISHSTSLDSFKDNCQTKQQKSLLRKIVSLNDINSTEADGDYILPSLLPSINVLHMQ